MLPCTHTQTQRGSKATMLPPAVMTTRHNITKINGKRWQNPLGLPTLSNVLPNPLGMIFGTAATLPHRQKKQIKYADIDNILSRDKLAWNEWTCKHVVRGGTLTRYTSKGTPASRRACPPNKARPTTFLHASTKEIFFFCFWLFAL